MGCIKATQTPIEGLYVIEPTIHKDDLGYFIESFNRFPIISLGFLICRYSP